MKGLSFIITTFNAQRSLGACLESISNQKYPKNRFEVLILDGGSTDKTKVIVKNYTRRIHIRFIKAGLKDNQEGRRYMGILAAKFDFICILDSDNYLISPDWIKRLCEPLESDKSLVATFTLHYAYDKQQTAFNRYLALIGGTDPVAYYMEKDDRMPYFTKKWPRPNNIVSQKKNYTVLKFNKENFPTLGSNGTVICKACLNLKLLSAKNYFHTDVLYDLLANKRNKYAVVNADLLHDTGSSFLNQISRRYKYMVLYHLDMQSERRYKIFDHSKPRDIYLLFKFAVITLTIVIPLKDAILGFLQSSDLVWFIHPIYCLVYLFIYSYAVIAHSIHRLHS